MLRFSKVFIIVCILIFVNNRFVYADEIDDLIESEKDTLGISSLLDDAENYTSEVFDEDELCQILEDAIHGRINNNQILKNVFSIFGNEFQECLCIMGSVILIVVLNGILNAFTEGFENKGVSNIANYVQIILIITVIVGNFSKVISGIRDSVNNMVSFVNILAPIIVTLIITTGNITTASVLEPILLFMTSFIGNFINNIAIPIVMAATSLGIISSISDKLQVERLAKRLKSFTIWVIGIILTAFVTLISLDGSLSSGVDAVTSKTAKAAVSNLVPVVGKILGDAVDSVIGCSSILKNAVGILGIIVIIAISLGPIIKLAMLMGVYYLTAAVCEPIADKKIIKLLEQMGETFKILLGFTCSMSVAIIIGTTIVVKMSNV